MKINTELCCKRYDFLTKKTQNYRYHNYCPGWQEFKSIHMAFYVNPSWACTRFRNNKQHVVLGQKRVSTRGRKRTLTDSERKMNRSKVSSKWGSVGPLEQTQGSATRPNSRSKWQRFCLIGKPSMFFPSFLNRFSYFMNLWWCLISFGRCYSIYVILHLATANYCQWIA